MASEIKRSYEFDGFEFDAQRPCLEYEHESVHLPPKSLQTLKVLLERRGETVSRDVLLSEIWRDAYVEDSNLTVAISTLRRALSSFSDREELIQTVPREGYRFVGNVSEKVNVTEQPIVIERHSREQITIETEDAADAYRRIKADRSWRPQWWTAVSIGFTLLAFLSVELAWRTLNSANADVLQPGRIAVLPFQSAGGAEKLIHGTYQVINGRIRVSLRLTNVADGKLLWQDAFDGEIAEIFLLQDRLASVAAAKLGGRHDLEPHLSRSTRNVEAYRSYLKAQHLFRMRGWNVKKSIPYFEQAIALDPYFAAAHAGLAAAYGMTSGYLEKASPTVETALRLEPNLADGHAVRGFLAIYHELDWQKAKESLDRALELDPNNFFAFDWRGEYHKLHRRFYDAERDLVRALEVRSAVSNFDV